MGGGHHHHNPAADPQTSQDLTAFAKAKTPLAFRDTCGHLLLPLNKCRRESYFRPDKCGDYRHVYEECQYNAYLQRCEAKTQETDIMTQRKKALAEAV